MATSRASLDEIMDVVILIWAPMKLAGLGCMLAGQAGSWVFAAVVEDGDALSLAENPIE